MMRRMTHEEAIKEINELSMKTSGMKHLLKALEFEKRLVN